MRKIDAAERYSSSALVNIYRLIPDLPLPRRAGRCAGGNVPIRAVRYCDAVTAASSYGWWMYAPMELWLLLKKGTVYWTCKGQSKWLPLGAAQFPKFADAFDEVVPEDLRGFSPPFLTALPEEGHVQIWTGYFVRTCPDWSVVVRHPVNFPANKFYTVFEGIVETDRWFGAIFANLRLHSFDTPVKIDGSVPLLQIQPLPRVAYSEATSLNALVLNQIGDLSCEDWQDFRKTVVRPEAQLAVGVVGSYAIQVRKRRRRE